MSGIGCCDNNGSGDNNNNNGGGENNNGGKHVNIYLKSIYCLDVISIAKNHFLFFNDYRYCNFR